MGDPIQNFEFILKKQTSKSYNLYSANKQQNKHTTKPQDVISSVYKQLKAIQAADTYKSEKCSKDLLKFKKPNFLSVNKLPVYEEVQKPSTTFDTQCVTDTQLINIIEDAEILEHHRGMTQEFETSFCHNTEKNEKNENTNGATEDTDSLKSTDRGKITVINLDKEDIKNNKRDENINVYLDTKNTEISTDNVTTNIKNVTEKENSEKVCKCIDIVSKSVVNKETIANVPEPDSLMVKFPETNINTDHSFSIISPIICLRDRDTNSNSQVVLIKDNSITSQGSKETNNTREMYSQIVNSDTKNDAENIERPVSPIFMQKNVKVKSKSPSPLIFNLDKFEQFEKIVIPLIEANDLKRVKQVIDSQILDKELLLKIDEEAILNDRVVLSPVLQKNANDPCVGSDTEFKSHKVIHPGFDTDVEFIELDKAISNDLINKVINEKAKSESDILKDEILFSSDEDESYVHKDYQDLPFTCALETSFYDQSDVLDKTMFVGFQTASNKSIQIFTESFAQARSFLTDVASDEITVTDLVQNCDSAVKIKTQDKKVIIDCSEEVIDLNLEQKIEPLIDFKENDVCKIKKNNFEGFMTANNKEIKLSEKALARCKKVFQDIDFNENFDTKIDDSLEVKEAKSCKNNIISISNNSKTAATINVANDAIQNIDDIIRQEFENIEMSLEENKFAEKENIASLEFKTASNKDIQITETVLLKIKDVFKDIDFNEDLNEADLPKENAIPKSANDNNNITIPVNLAFRTASNKKIDISNEALTKSKKVFHDIDSIELLNKVDSKLEKQNNNLDDLELPSTSKAFVGFRTANNKNIKISDQAVAKTKIVFKDIDSEEFKFHKKYKKLETYEDNMYDQPSTSKSSFSGFKTANNENIAIYKEALAKTKNIFKDIESTNIEISTEIRNNENIDLNQPTRTSKISYSGFKTANNREIQISDAALAKSKHVFKDVDSSDFNFEDRKSRDFENVDLRGKSIKKNAIGFNDTLNFVGFKTANNKEIKISDKSLANTKNIFKDIDSVDFKFPEKGNKVNVETTSRELEMTDSNQPTTSKVNFVGFHHTANNKKISISKESLAKTKDIFHAIDANDFKFPKKSKGSDITYPDMKDQVYFENKYSFIGFKTANNKPITISETAIAKTKDIFKEIDPTEFMPPGKRKEDYPDFKVDSMVNEGIGKTENIIVSEGQIPTFQGFQTASKKEVKISSDALLKSRMILQNIDVTENLKDKIGNKDIFYTENNDENSKDSLHDKETFVSTENNIPNDNTSRKTSPVFKGFQTANKKPVTISKEALAKSKKLFEDIEMTLNDFEPAFHGFQIASEKKVTVSEKAMAETKNILDNEIKDGNVFKGFQTASDKKVVISEDSLARCKKVFEDLDLSLNHENTAQDSKKKTSVKFGFKTGTDKDVLVSKEAIKRTKRRFSQIDDSSDLNKKDKMNIKDIDDNIIDTQVLNNFEESLHTEDFHDTPKKSKRSGSPILSCPRAKKRKKFEIPYSQKLPNPEPKKEVIDNNTNDNKITFTDNYKRKKFEIPYSQKLSNPEPKKKVIDNNTNDNKITFTDNYKKNKLYNLKDLEKISMHNNTSVDPYLLQLNFDNLLQFEFHGNRNGLSDGNMTINLLKELFLNSVNQKLIPKGWLENHLKLILWKLISYEVKFKSAVICNARNVIDQLKYRYDKELYNAQRPALRKILEKDDVASKTIVLCVAGLYVDGVNVASATTTDNLELLLTDGWYCIKASIDKMLAQHVCTGKISVGTKIATTGAELMNCEQGISPWEDTSAVRLKIFGNSTRRARWDARLGYHGNGAILSHLSSVTLDGGKVSKLRVFVTRVYPAMYVEKFDDGSTVTRSERLEHLHQIKSEADRQAVMEKIYEEVEKEFSSQDSQDSEGLSDSSTKRSCLDSGSQIAKVMKRSKDPAEFRAELTSSQTRLLEAHTSKRQELLLEDIQKRVRQKIETAGVCVNRNVVTLLKIRVAGLKERNGVQVTKGMMSIWKPNDAILEIIKEGTWIDVMNVVPTAIRYNELQISAGRQSVFSISKYKENEEFKPYTNLLKRNCFTIKDLSQNPSMSTDYNEIDTVGLIFLIEPTYQDFDTNKQPFQNIYLADPDKNIIGINFWGGLKKFGFQNVLDTGQIVACANLQKRAGNTRKTIPQYRVTEFSYFTKTPKNYNARNIVDELNKKFSNLDRRKFCDDCVLLKNNYSVLKCNNENISPYRFNTTDYNTSKHKIFIDSPLARPRIDDIFNLTGLDFESTFKQTDTQNLSEEMLRRKKKVNEKIARLKIYGEPPALTNIHLINKSKNASMSYKSPLISRHDNSKCIQKSKNENPLHSTSDSSFGSVHDTSEKTNVNDEMCSPVILNRTYIKSVNPVKIDFDVIDDNENSVDHFAEEFDGSPPLSLD